jgi:hypothetical protein
MSWTERYQTSHSPLHLRSAGGWVGLWQCVVAGVLHLLVRTSPLGGSYLGSAQRWLAGWLRDLAGRVGVQQSHPALNLRKRSLCGGTAKKSLVKTGRGLMTRALYERLRARRLGDHCLVSPFLPLLPCTIIDGAAPFLCKDSATDPHGKAETCVSLAITGTIQHEIYPGKEEGA